MSKDSVTRPFQDFREFVVTHSPESSRTASSRKLALLLGLSKFSLRATFFLARRYDQATEQGAKILELDPKFLPAYYVRGVAYVKKSMYKEAMAEFEKAVSISADDLAALTAGIRLCRNG